MPVSLYSTSSWFCCKRVGSYDTISDPITIVFNHKKIGVLVSMNNVLNRTSLVKCGSEEGGIYASCHEKNIRFMVYSK